MNLVPPGYQVQRTDERVSVMGTRMTRWGAERLAASNPPIMPSYHLRVEKVGVLKWEVVAYQNRLEKVG